MGLLNTLKSALGLNTPVVPRDPEPLRLTDPALSRLSQLPPGHGIHVSTRRAARGRVVLVDEGEAQGPPPAGYDRMTVGDRDLERLRGLVLDYRDGGWHVTTQLDLRARETPNPNGRVYLCNRWLAEGRPLFFTAEREGLPDLPAELLDVPGVQTVLLRENTITIERQPDAPWDAIDAGVNSALRTYFLGTGHRISGEEVDRDGLVAEVQAVLEKNILPGIHADGGDIELVSIDEGVVFVRMQGACRSCPASTATLKLGVERTLKAAFPDRIRAVEQI
ncbi:MAG: NifU family protein [Alphaproteobacteria bacterium]|nr:NifU family protein [Alphaproteobacteria bacterium]